MKTFRGCFVRVKMVMGYLVIDITMAIDAETPQGKLYNQESDCTDQRF